LKLYSQNELTVKVTDRAPITFSKLRFNRSTDTTSRYFKSLFQLHFSLTAVDPILRCRRELLRFDSIRGHVFSRKHVRTAWQQKQMESKHRISQAEIAQSDTSANSVISESSFVSHLFCNHFHQYDIGNHINVSRRTAENIYLPRSSIAMTPLPYLEMDFLSSYLQTGENKKSWHRVILPNT
jgi:hypothetical protein